jgi:hypothetical protein
MSNLIICNPSVSDAGTITASDTVSGFPATNLLTTQPGEVWRSTDLLNSYLELDLASAQDIKAVWLGYTNLTSGATWRIRMADSQYNLTAFPGYDSGDIEVWPDGTTTDWDRVHGLHFIDGPVEYRWIRIDIEDPTNTDAYIQAGRLIVAETFQPHKNTAWGFGITYQNQVTEMRTMGGASYRAPAPMFRVAEGQLQYMTEPDAYDEFAKLQRLKGSQNPILFVLDPDDEERMQQYTIYGHFGELYPITHQIPHRFNSGFQIIEMEHP